IIALSEEYNIITPYTSFLVLETDADRERFKVKQRFRMRDGEKFFAEGRDNANYELVQQQMKKAGNWRLGLRRTILQQLASLGRDPRMFRQRSHEERLGSIYAGSALQFDATGLSCAPEYLASRASAAEGRIYFGFETALDELGDFKAT